MTSPSQQLRLNRPFSEWEVTEVTIISCQEQLDDLSTQIEQLRTQNSEQQIVIRYLEQNRTVQMTPAPSSVKTTKIPDPDPLSDGKDPTFENWKIQRSRSRDPDRGQVHCEPRPLPYRTDQNDLRLRAYDWRCTDGPKTTIRRRRGLVHNHNLS